VLRIIKHLFFSKSYILINFFFAVIILMIFVYSAIFSAQKNNHPIPSFCPHEPCASTGLSRSFSEIIRLNFDSAKKFNINGIRIFLFFLIQLFLRVMFSLLYYKSSKNKVILIDSIVSLSLFFITFKNFIILLF